METSHIPLHEIRASLGRAYEHLQQVEEEQHDALHHGPQTADDHLGYLIRQLHAQDVLPKMPNAHTDPADYPPPIAKLVLIDGIIAVMKQAATDLPPKMDMFNLSMAHKVLISELGIRAQYEERLKQLSSHGETHQHFHRIC